MNRLAGLILSALFYASTGWADPDRLRSLPGIIGKDDRVPQDSTAWPWHSLGRLTINREKGEYC
ncbi:MAG: hypothetical protein ACR2HF_11790, partial [Methylococcaceae bacterium]